MSNQYEQLENEILSRLFEASSHRIKPRDLEDHVSEKLGAPASAVRKTINSLVADGYLTCTFQDSYEYLEIAPAEPHHAARPRLS